MRIAFPIAGMDIELHENSVQIVAIENTEIYVRFLSDLCAEINGNDGDVIISDSDKQVVLSKKCELIFNPIELDFNNKKIINKLYQELKEQCDEVLIQEAAQLNSEIISFLDQILELSQYSITYNFDFDIMGIFKLYDVKLCNTTDSLLEKIIEYIRIMHRICGISIFIFVNLKDFLSIDEINMLYEFIKYEKIYLIVLESRYNYKANEEIAWILDKDRCLIKPDEETI